MLHTQVPSRADDRDFVAPAFTGAPDVQFRPETADDLPFLHALYASTREDELAGTDWSSAQKADFLHMQFGLQHRYYQQHFSDAAFDIIESAGTPIGRRYIQRRADGITLIDMALLPAWRGHGIGSAILHELLAEAVGTHRSVLLHVEHDNPANRLYARCGFAEISCSGVHRKLCWTPSQSSSPSPTCAEIAP